MVAIMGPSGSGKSTLLHLLAALDTPTSGAVYFAGNSLQSLTEVQLAEYRNPEWVCLAEAPFAARFYRGGKCRHASACEWRSPGPALRTAQDWLAEVGLEDRAQQRAGELSGGEQQRVAIARALVNQPDLLLADEPTGDLDERSAENIFELMQRLHESHHLTSIVATHNLMLARRTDRVLNLEHGNLTPYVEVPAAAAYRGRPAGTGAKTPGERG